MKVWHIEYATRAYPADPWFPVVAVASTEVNANEYAEIMRGRMIGAPSVPACDCVKVTGPFEHDMPNGPVHK